MSFLSPFIYDVRKSCTHNQEQENISGEKKLKEKVVWKRCVKKNI